MSHATRIEDPFFYVDAVAGTEHKNTEAPGVQIMSVDILPSELPMESSQHFSDSLYPFIKELVSLQAYLSFVFCWWTEDVLTVFPPRLLDP